MENHIIIIDNKKNDITKIYKSWLKRTKNITDDCGCCDNKRYYISISYCYSFCTLYACPSCNFDDLKIVKKCGFEQIQILNALKRIKEVGKC